MDLAHDLNVIQMFDADITTDTTTNGYILDTQDYNSVAFAMGAPTMTSGTITLSIYEGDESDMSDGAEVTNIVFSSAADLAAQLADGDAWAKQGVYDTKRYLRVRVVSTGVTGTAHIVVVALVDLALKPADQG